MKRFLVPYLPEKSGDRIDLPESEAHHALHVFRLKEGDRVEAVDGRGGYCVAEIHLARSTRDFKVSLQRVDSETSGGGAAGVLPLVLEVAVLKGDAMEWVIEKSVELGVESVQPLVTDHTVVQIAKKGSDRFRERWQKIADQALKQSERLVHLEVKEPLPIQDAFSHSLENEVRLWACERTAQARDLWSWLLEQKGATARRIRFLVGPEGGWSASEKEWISREKVVPVNLGPLILRAETAALSGLAQIAAALRA